MKTLLGYDQNRKLGIWSQTNPKVEVPFYCERVKIPIKGQVVISTYCLRCGVNLSGVGRGVSTVIFRGLGWEGGLLTGGRVAKRNCNPEVLVSSPAVTAVGLVRQRSS